MILYIYIYIYVCILEEIAKHNSIQIAYEQKEQRQGLLLCLEFYLLFPHLLATWKKTAQIERTGLMECPFSMHLQSQRGSLFAFPASHKDIPTQGIGFFKRALWKRRNMDSLRFLQQEIV